MLQPIVRADPHRRAAKLKRLQKHQRCIAQQLGQLVHQRERYREYYQRTALMSRAKCHGHVQQQRGDAKSELHHEGDEQTMRRQART